MSMSSSNLRNVNVIYNDSSLYRIHQTKQSTDKSCPSTTGPANNSNFVPSFKYTTYPQNPISNSFHADIVNTKTTITNIQTTRLDSVQKTLIFLVFEKRSWQISFLQFIEQANSRTRICNQLFLVECIYLQTKARQFYYSPKTLRWEMNY